MTSLEQSLSLHLISRHNSVYKNSFLCEQIDQISQEQHFQLILKGAQAYRLDCQFIPHSFVLKFNFNAMMTCLGQLFAFAIKCAPLSV